MPPRTYVGTRQNFRMTSRIIVLNIPITDGIPTKTTSIESRNILTP